jgi:hypothetical protein
MICQPVEDGFSDSVGGWAKSLCVWEAEFSAAPLPADHADLICGLPRSTFAHDAST